MYSKKDGHGGYSEGPSYTPPNWRVAHPCATYKKELKNCYDHPSSSGCFSLHMSLKTYTIMCVMASEWLYPAFLSIVPHLLLSASWSILPEDLHDGVGCESNGNLNLSPIQCRFILLRVSTYKCDLYMAAFRPCGEWGSALLRAEENSSHLLWQNCITLFPEFLMVF